MGFQAVLRRRDNIQADFEAKTEALATKKADRDSVSLLLTLSILHVIRPALLWKFTGIIFNKTEL